jgi:hypothetical protein
MYTKNENTTTTERRGLSFNTAYYEMPTAVRRMNKSYRLCKTTKSKRLLVLRHRRKTQQRIRFLRLFVEFKIIALAVSTVEGQLCNPHLQAQLDPVELQPKVICGSAHCRRRSESIIVDKDIPPFSVEFLKLLPPQFEALV